MHSISFSSQGYRLSGNFFTAPNPQPLAFLLIQGWAGRQNIEAAQALADLGFTSLTYDMRGNGDSEGELAKFSRADFMADSVADQKNLEHAVLHDAPHRLDSNRLRAEYVELLTSWAKQFIL